jgi:copper homeostasis protein (lipoprotein)
VLLVDLEGQVAMRPNPDTGRPFPTLLVAKYVGIWPGETCSGAIGSPKFGETDWKLTRLENQPVLLEEKQRGPSMIFRTEESRASGFGGCNALTGDYKSNGEELSIGTLAVTRMDCAQGAELEATFLKVLARVRRWKIVQQHLELYDEGGAVVARFEARSPN